MNWQDVRQVTDVRHDGFGLRRFQEDGIWGRVERLTLSPALSTPAAEQAIRARASRFITGRVPVVVPLYSIAREEHGVSIVSGAPDGATLADLLGAIEFGTVSMNDGALLELGGLVARAVSSMHEAAGTCAHAALSPAHVRLCADGRVLLTGAVFGDALQSLRRNREQFWREFGVALPPSAGLPRFDHRSDVTQLGAIVLAILTRRALTPAEYPREIGELIHASTESMEVSTACRTGLRLWLQQALQLQARAPFASAVDAEHAYRAVVERVHRRLALREILPRLRVN